MDSEKIFRTSVFGGFKRNDVLSYVDELKNEMESLKSEMTDKDVEIGTLNEKTDALSEQCESLRAFQDKYEQQEKIVELLQADKNELRQKIAELQSVVDTYAKAQSGLREKEEKIKTAESQLGAAFLDARKYSDEIVSAANHKALEISDKVSGDISTQANAITKLSAEVDSIAQQFSKSIEELHSNITALARKMAVSASELSNRKSAPAFVPDVSIKIDEIGEKVDKVIEDPESGLTFIQYPPNTGFNDDLNITPQSVFKFDKPKEG